MKMRGIGARNRVITVIAGVAVVLSLAAPLAPVALQEVSEVADGTPAAASARAVNAPVSPEPVELVDGDAAEATESAEAAYEPGVVLARIAEGATAASLNEAISKVPAVANTVVSDSDIAAGFAELELAEGADVAAAIPALSAIEGIEGAQPNFIYHIVDDAVSNEGGLQRAVTKIAMAASQAAERVNDPKVDEQWYLDDEHGAKMGGAWDIVKGEEADPAVGVAVIDTGCQLDHPDIKDNIAACWNVIDGTPTCVPADGDKNHGTHVSGIIAAVSNNAVGIAGTSYNTRIVPIRIIESGGDTNTLYLKKALDYVKAHQDDLNIRVANVSIGAAKPSAYASDDIIMFEAMKEVSEKTLIVAASGNNSSTSPFFPGDNVAAGYDIINGNLVEGDCSAPLGLNVIALTNEGERASFSNYNASGVKTRDISAPGESIYSTIRGSSYDSKKGTSMAAPIVSGTAALVFAANPDLTPREVIDILHESATDLGAEGFDAATGYGEVNAAAAVRAALPKLSGGSEVAEGSSLVLSTPSSGDWTWRSSDESVATVTDGTVTGKSEGEATIVAVSGQKRAYKDIVVTPAPASESSSSSTVGETDESSSGSLPSSSTSSSANADQGSGGSSDSTSSTSSSEAISISGSSSESSSSSSSSSSGGAESSSSTSASSNAEPSASSRSTVGESDEPSASSSAISSEPSSSTSSSAEPSASSSSEEARESTSSPSETTTSRSASSSSSEASSLTVASSSSHEAVPNDSTSSTGSSESTSVSSSTASSASATNSNPESLESSSSQPGSDETTAESEIEPQPAIYDVAQATIDPIGSYVYTGNFIKPAPTVRIGGAVVESSRYTISYANNMRAGTATVTVTGTGDFRNLHASTTFTILKAKQSIRAKTTTGKVKANLVKQKKRLVTCVKKVTGKKSSLCFKKASGSKRLTVNTRTGTVTVKKGTKKGVYSIKVKIYAKASANYLKSNTLTKRLKVKVV